MVIRVVVTRDKLLHFSLMTELLQVRQELNDRMRSDIHEQRIKLKSIKLVNYLF